MDERIKVLGAAIREARLKRGLSQTELAAGSASPPTSRSPTPWA